MLGHIVNHDLNSSLHINYLLSVFEFWKDPTDLWNYPRTTPKYSYIFVITHSTVIKVIPKSMFSTTVSTHKKNVISMWRYDGSKLLQLFNFDVLLSLFYDILLPCGCYLIDDFDTSISFTNTWRFKTFPVHLVVWHYHLCESSVHAVEWISCKLKTSPSPQSQHWQRCSPVSFIWVQDETWFRMFSSIFFGSLTEFINSSRPLSSFRNKFIMSLSSSIDSLQHLLIVTVIIRFSNPDRKVINNLIRQNHLFSQLYFCTFS